VFETLTKFPWDRFAAGHIELSMPWSAWAALCVTLALGVWWGLRYNRLGPPRVRALLGGARYLLLVVLITLLLDPHLVTPASTSRENGVAVLMDTSASMTLPASRTETRAMQIVDALGPKSGALPTLVRDRVSLSYRTFGEESAPLTSGDALRFDAGRADLGAAIESLLASGAVPGAIVVATDGGVQVDKALMRSLLDARAAGVAVHTVSADTLAPNPDIEVAIGRVASSVLRGGTVRVPVRLINRGLSQHTVVVRLEADGLVIQRRELSLARSGTDQLTFDYVAEHPGSSRLVVSVAPFVDEAVTQNNHQAINLRVREEPVDVLHFEAEPRFEVKFLRRALSSDQAVRLVSVVRTAENKFYRLGVTSPEQMASGFPDKLADLLEFEVIVLGSVGREDLTDAQMAVLAMFVEQRGGGVLFLGGRRSFAEGGLANTVLAKLLPVRLGDPEPGFRRQFVLSPDSRARQHPLAVLARGSDRVAPFEEMPPLTFINPIRAAKPGATVLLRTRDVDGDDAGLIGLAYHRFGRGMVAVLPVRDLWRWQMHSSVPLEDETHERTWQHLMRWLGGSAPRRLSVQLNPVAVAPGQSFDVDVLALGAQYGPRVNPALIIEMSAPGGAVIAPPVTWKATGDGTYSAELQAPATGPVIVTVRDRNAKEPGATALLEVKPVGTEFESDSTSDNAMEMIAERTGGKRFKIGEMAALAALLQPRTRASTEIERLALWNAPIWLLVALLLVSFEWLVRRRWVMA
jgi:hypothetical protein